MASSTIRARCGVLTTLVINRLNSYGGLQALRLLHDGPQTADQLLQRFFTVRAQRIVTAFWIWAAGFRTNDAISDLGRKLKMRKIAGECILINSLIGMRQIQIAA